MALPYVSEAMAAKIRGYAARGFATVARVQGTVSVVLARWDEAQQKHVAVPAGAQAVVVEWANRAERGTESDSAAATFVDGYLVKEAPFDAKTGDVFSFGNAGDELAGRVEFVRPADMAGVVKAAFVLRTGEM